MKPKLDDDAKGNKIRAHQPNLKVLHHMDVDNGPRDSTSRLTSYMPWQITRRKLECLVLQIHIQLNAYILSLCMPQQTKTFCNDPAYRLTFSPYLVI